MNWIVKLVIITVCFSNLVQAYENVTVTIYTEHFPPYNFREGDNIKGINHDIVARTCEVAGIKCKFKMYPWQRAMALSLSKRFAGLVSTSRLPDREAHFQWVGPLVSSPACFYKLAHRSDISIESKQQLNHYTVGLNKGDVYEHVLQNWGMQENVNYVIYSEKFGEVDAFKKGKLDLFIASANTLQYHIDSDRLALHEVEPVFVISDEALLGNYLALNLAMPIEIVEKLQNALIELNQSNEIQLIKKRYIPTAQSVISESELSLAKRCIYG
ncbi:substrate-binding periplasmic protein [Pseudoalteromonas spongiae]|uniref:substrate-binding periplasmic protein n=1 Tax=Pseudoalteromonas spongiae TaxID=298657 RepID=UPI0009FC1F3A|nr:transporter substrate-binding domain-containing protein [Pseudoalteromonas spongiae]